MTAYPYPAKSAPPPPAGYRYFRFTWPAVPHLTDYSFWGADLVTGTTFPGLYVGATCYPTVGMTSDTTPSPLVATAYNDPSPAATAYRAFSKAQVSWNLDESFYVQPAWLQLDLGAGNLILPTQIGIIDFQLPEGAELIVAGSNTGVFGGEEHVFYDDTPVLTDSYVLILLPAT